MNSTKKNILLIASISAVALAISATAYGSVYCTPILEVWELELTSVTVDGEEIQALGEYEELEFFLRESSYPSLHFEIREAGRQLEVMHLFDDAELPEALRDHVESLEDQGGR